MPAALAEKVRGFELLESHPSGRRIKEKINKATDPGPDRTRYPINFHSEKMRRKGAVNKDVSNSICMGNGTDRPIIETKRPSYG